MLLRQRGYGLGRLEKRVTRGFPNCYAQGRRFVYGDVSARILGYPRSNPLLSGWLLLGPPPQGPPLTGSWCRQSGSNGRPSVYKTAALPSELCRQLPVVGRLVEDHVLVVPRLELVEAVIQLLCDPFSRGVFAAAREDPYVLGCEAFGAVEPLLCQIHRVHAVLPEK